MRNFHVLVNDTAYDVVIDLADPNVKMVGMPLNDPIPAVPPQRGAQRMDKTRRPSLTPASREGKRVTAPVPGSVRDLRVYPGQNVKKGDVLMSITYAGKTLPVICPFTGRIGRISVSENSEVNSGTLLCIIG